jgi:hypothetical protein
MVHAINPQGQWQLGRIVNRHEISIKNFIVGDHTNGHSTGGKIFPDCRCKGAIDNRRASAPYPASKHAIDNTTRSAEIATQVFPFRTSKNPDWKFTVLIVPQFLNLFTARRSNHR